MKAKYNSIYKYCIYLIIFLNLGFFDLFIRFDSYAMLISVFLSIFIFCIYLIQPKKSPINHLWVLIYVILVLSIFLFQLFRLRTLNISSITVKQAVNNYDGVWLLLIIFPFYELLQSSSSYEIFKGIAFLGYSALLIRLVIWGLYNFTNYHPINYLIHALDWTRPILGKNFIRVSGTFLDGYLLIFSLNNLFTKKKHAKYIISILFIYFYSIFVSQYRMVIIAMIFITIMAVIIKSNNKKNKLISNLLILFILLLFLFIFANLINEFLNTFSTANIAMGGSTSARINGFQYFLTQWKETSIPWGFGFRTDNANYLWYTYWLSDYGILANLFQFGIVGFIIYLIPYIVGIFYSIRNIFNLKALYVIGLTFYILITSITFNPMWNQYIALMPIYIVLLINLDRKEVKNDPKNYYNYSSIQ